MSALQRRDARHVHESKFPNMTPMVDIMLVLLIFFMTGTVFVSRELLLRTNLAHRAPTGVADPFSLPEARVELALVRDNDRTLVRVLGATTVSINQVQTMLARFSEGVDPTQVIVTIASAPDVPYDDVVRVHEACHALKLTRVTLVLENKPQPAIEQIPENTSR